MPKLYNIHDKNAPKEAIFIGRGGMWGNPYVIGKHGDRDECVNRFETLVKSSKYLQKVIKEELAGKDLVCFCSPARCHGDIMLEIANDV